MKKHHPIIPEQRYHIAPCHKSTFYYVFIALFSILCTTHAAELQRTALDPSFSPDGTRLVFCLSIKGDGGLLTQTQEIWTSGRFGSRAKRLTQGHDDTHPRFSPNGKNIAFTRDGDIWMINADGSNLRNITQTNLPSEAGAEFTADGNLVFIRQSSTNNNSHQEVKDALLEGQLFALSATRSQRVVWRNLKDGTEKVLLEDGYHVDQLSPNPANSNQIFILCRPIDKKTGKPLQLNPDELPRRIIAMITLRGGSPRIVLEPKTKDGLQISQFRTSRTLQIYAMAPPYGSASEVALWSEGQFIKLPNAPMLGDLSRDGETILGIGYADNWPSGKGIILYNIENQTRQRVSAPKF